MQNQCWFPKLASMKMTSFLTTSIFSNNACDDKIAHGEDLVNTTVQHLQDKNFLALIGDLSSVTSWVNDFKSSCLSQTDACNTESTGITNNIQSLLNDLKAFNQSSTKTDAEGVINALFTWKNDCVKPQQSQFAALTKSLNLLGGDVCSGKISSLVDLATKTATDVQNKNALALIGDVSDISSWVNDFTKTCVVTSDDCTTKSTAITTNANNLYTHLKAFDHDNSIKDTDSLVDAFYTWKNACLKSQ